MSDKQKKRSCETKQSNQQTQNPAGNTRQEIPDLGGKSQHQKPEMKGGRCRPGC